MTNKVDKLIQEWRDIGPVKWSESEFGWTGIDGRPIELSAWQRAVVGAWWANRETTTTLAISNIKKSGKTLIDAVLLAWRWLALPGLHFAVANDLDQSTSRQFGEIYDMCKRNKFLRENVTFTAKKLTFVPTGSVLEALSGDATGNAGANFLTVSHTECWGILHEQDVRNWEELTVPPLKFYGLPALRIADSYAGHLAESDTWHNLVDRGLEGERITSVWPIYKIGGILLFHIAGKEGQKRCFRGTPEEAKVYYEDQAVTLRPNTYQRLHENKRTASLGSFVDLEAWERLVDPDHRPLAPGSKTKVYIGLDLAVAPRGDDCALIGVYAEGEQVKVAFHKVWTGRLRVRKLNLSKTVEPYILQIKEDYNLAGCWYDPWQAVKLSDDLRSAGVSCYEVKQTHASRGPKDSVLYELASSGRLVLYDNAELRGMAAGANAKELGNGQIFLTKAGGRQKIDLLIALANVADVAAMWGSSGGIQVMPNFFYEWDHAKVSDFMEIGGSYEYMPERKVKHSPGATSWRDCKHRTKGCEACIRDMTKEGVYERDAEQVRRLGEPMSEEQFYGDRALTSGSYHARIEKERRQNELQNTRSKLRAAYERQKRVK